MTYYRRTVTPFVWGAVIGLAMIAGLWFAHTAAVDAAFSRGRQTAADGVAFDSLLLERAAVRVAKQMAHTDTVVRQTKASAKKATAAVAALSPDVAALPPVDTLVQAVTELVAHVDTLTHAITSERAAWTEKAKVDSAAISALRILGTAQADTITTLKRRPTKAKAFAYALGSAALGFFVGVVR